MNDRGNWNSSLSTQKGHGSENVNTETVQVARAERSQLNDFKVSPGFIHFKNPIIHILPAAVAPFSWQKNLMQASGFVFDG